MSIEGTTHLCEPMRDMTDPGIKLLQAKFRRHVEDYLKYIRKFGRTFTNEEVVSELKSRYGKKGGGHRFMYEIVMGGIDAHEYIFDSNGDGSVLLDFEPTCDLLDVDFHRLRRKLVSIDKKEAAQILNAFHKMYGHQKCLGE